MAGYERLDVIDHKSAPWVCICNAGLGPRDKRIEEIAFVEVQAAFPRALDDYEIDPFEGRVAAVLVHVPRSMECALGKELVGEDRAVPHKTIHAVLSLARFEHPIGHARLELGRGEERGIDIRTIVEDAPVAAGGAVESNEATEDDDSEGAARKTEPKNGTVVPPQPRGDQR